MDVRILGANALFLLAAQIPLFDTAAQEAERGNAAAWRTLERDANVGPKVTNASSTDGLRTASSSGVLPNDHGQVWREYDITRYTSKVTSTAKPEQAIIDWILRETGTEVWFSEPLGVLNAKRDKLIVYHTPEMQRLVADIVSRFVSNETESQVLGLRLTTINSPNWRSRAHPLLRPIDVHTQGIEAWLVSKENAAVLLAELAKRTDYQEHSSPNLLVHNGQSHTISRTRPRNYVRTVRTRNDAWPGHELQMGQVEEGFSLQLSPLVSSDGTTIDVVVKCHIDQVEKFVSVPIDLPSLSGQTQRVQVQVPQMVCWRLHERFRWPTDDVLLLSCGVVASPTSERPTMFGIPNPLALGPGRADALLFIESKGKASQTLVDSQRAANGANSTYRNRY